jgi:plastocyanin
MRFSVITAVCAAPLALAGSLEANLAARGAVEVVEVNSNSNQIQNGNTRLNKNNNNNPANFVLQNVQSTEVIIIWANAGAGAATTTINQPVTVTQTVAGVASAASTSTHIVTVGGAKVVFTPEFVNAQVGDMVVFEFQQTNHTVTQSNFATPCEAVSNGIDSGFMANANNSISPAPQLAIQVTVSTPIWFYCRQATHCGKGMTFSVNPTAAKTQADFKAQAIAQNGTAAAAPPAAGAGTSSAAATSGLATAVIVGGPAKATEAAASTSSAASSMVPGTGTTVAGGACACSCLCGVAAFPNAAVQGLASFGGLSGAMPMSALEA